MAILRDIFTPTVQPQPVQLLPSQLKMLQQQQPNSYQQVFQPQPTSPAVALQTQFMDQSNQNNQQQNNDTASRLQGQFAVGFQNAANLPQPNPVANNAQASSQTNPVNNFYAQAAVRPNLQSYYDQLNSILQSGQEATLAEEARAAAKQQALMQQLSQFSQGSNAPTSNPVGSVGPGPGPTGASREANQALGKSLTGQVGWTGDEWNAFNKLVMMESGWNNTAQNPTSTAYGIGQFLDSTWGGYGAHKTSDPRQQIEAMIRYIQARYGDPLNALKHENSSHWY